MTGKTHMAVSAATAAVVMAAMGANASKGIPHLLPFDTTGPGTSSAGPYAIAGLLLLGMVAGLFPDLDAPDTELQHLPQRVSDHLAKYIKAGTPVWATPRRSAFPGAAQELVRLALHFAMLPFALVFAAVGAGLRLFTGHRGFTHTLWGTLTFTGLIVGVAFLITDDTQCALVVGAVWGSGYASHLAADACTPSGIPLLRTPNVAARGGRLRKTRSRRYCNVEGNRASILAMPYHPATSSSSTSLFHLLPRRMRIRTGAPADILLIRWTGWAVCIAAVVLMFIS